MGTENSNAIPIPIGDKTLMFGRITLDHISAAADYANAAVYRSAIAAALPPEASIYEKAQLIRGIGKPFHIGKIDVMMEDFDCVLELLWQSYKTANHPTSNSPELRKAFVKMLDFSGLVQMQVFIDKLVDDGEGDDACPPDAEKVNEKA